MESKETCKWESNQGMYRNTGCGNSCYEEYDGVLEKYKFCPYCGNLIQEVIHEE